MVGGRFIEEERNLRIWSGPAGSWFYLIIIEIVRNKTHNNYGGHRSCGDASLHVATSMYSRCRVVESVDSPDTSNQRKIKIFLRRMTAITELCQGPTQSRVYYSGARAPAGPSACVSRKRCLTWSISERHLYDQPLLMSLSSTERRACRVSHAFEVYY